MVILVNHSVPSEGVQHTEPNVVVNVENVDVGEGTLYITESCVVWLNSQDQGLLLQYKLISLHAISRDLNAFPREHLLCHYEGKIPGVNEPNDDDDDDEDEIETDPEPTLVEVRFAPQNKNSLESMFEALASCQTLHPDSDCQLSDEEEFEDAEEPGDIEQIGAGDTIYTSEDGFNNLTEEGRATLERLNQMLITGQGDADMSARNNQVQVNGFHSGDGADHNGDVQMDADQFEDVDDSNQ